MFGVYDILETVGQGGMGVVYRAQDTALDRIVALKVLKEDLRQSKQIAARFQREAEAIASLNHPNIVHIYSVGAVGRIPYIAMEFITGAPLSAVMKRSKSIPWKRALHIAEQVAEALACAHDAHIIHRDIKPGNILIGANDRAYVTDFGIAKVLTAETQLTVEGSRLGTPHYMSPERCSKADITPSSDLYSLGVVLFQLLSGRLPYEASAPVELIRKIVASPPTRLSEIAPDLPEDIERFVAYLIEKKPADRPKSAADVARMCRRLIDGEPLFDDDGVAASLKDFRENQPTPSTTSTHIDSALLEARGAVARAGRAWQRIPATAKVWTAGILLIALMALLGQWTARQSFGGYALATVGRWDQSTVGWSALTAPAEWTTETEGVHVARLNFSEASVGTIAAVGPTQFAVELDASNSKTGGMTELLVDAPAPKVRVALPPALAGADAPHLLAGTGGLDTALFYVGSARRASRALAPAVVRMDTGVLDDSLGEPVLFLDDLQSAVGAPVVEILGFALSGDTGRLAVVARAQDVSGVHVVQCALQLPAPATTFVPLVLGATEIGGMVYDDDGNLHVAQRTAAGWSCVRFRGNAKVPKPEDVFKLPGDESAIVQLTQSGALVRTQGSGEPEFEWRPFAGTSGWTLGDGKHAMVLPDESAAVISAPDRRGNLQWWRVLRSAPENREQVTYLDDGVQPEFTLSNDGRYALGSAHSAKATMLILADLEAVNAE